MSDNQITAAVIVFPGSNCDRDMAGALEASGAKVHMVWHKECALPTGVDLVALPGGFSYGDYLRCGAIAAHSQIMKSVCDHAARGGFVLGVCNGFQVLTEAHILPGALIRNGAIKFVSKMVDLEVTETQSIFTSRFAKGDRLAIPVAHHDGNYRISEDQYKELIQEERIAFRYDQNPNGAFDDIAGVLSRNKRVLGMMPHPERAWAAHHQSQDGAGIFNALVTQLLAA